MAAAARAVSSSGVSTPKWQIALAIAAPVAIGVGIWYYRSRKQPASAADCNKPPKLDDVKVNDATDDKKNASGEASKTSNPAVKSKVELEDPSKQSQEYKTKGNKCFKEGKYADAIKYYQQAIDVCPKERTHDVSTFHQNRAAAYEQLKNYEAVIRDCTEALKYNSRYIKALHRRAKAFEVTKQLENALEDITAVCILEGFSNQSSLLMADRVLKELGKEHAKEAIANRQPVIPSKHFVNTFMCSFCRDPVFNLVKEDSRELKDENSGFSKALEKMRTREFENIISLCTEEIESNSEDAKSKLLARLLRGTFYSLMGDTQKALDDLTEVFNESKETDVKVNSLIKSATLKMHSGASEEGLHDLLIAAELGPDNADVFHHRGQVYMLLDQAAEAMSDFAKAVSLNPNFPIAVVQKLYTDYRMAAATGNDSQVQAAIRAFEDAIEKFPNCPECYLLYAQVLSDRQEYKKADEYYMKAVEIDPLNSSAYVHRGLVQLQSDGNIDSATSLIQEAIKMDSKCEFAYETLGTIEVQRGNLKKAIELFDKAIPLSRTEIEVSHLFSLKDAALAQLKVAQKLGVVLPSS